MVFWQKYAGGKLMVDYGPSERGAKIGVTVTVRNKF
jgi:hypothetical protein